MNDPLNRDRFHLSIYGRRAYIAILDVISLAVAT